MKKSILALGAVILAFPVLVRAVEPDDPYYARQRVNLEQIGLPVAWNYTTGSRDIVVAVIDTGADIEHPDLRDNIWTNPGEIADNGRDDDNNGFVDDIHGWNFVNDTNDVRTSVFGVGDVEEDISHGTLISGIIGAVGDNNQGVTGVNWQVKIMPLRAINNDGTGLYSDIAQAARYAADMGASVISMSVVGDEFSQDLRDAFRYAYDRGVVMVAAAGNNQVDNAGDLTRIPRYPICLDRDDEENWLLGVSAVDTGDRLSFFANYGLCVDILAPGEDIYSTDHYAPQYGFFDSVTGPWRGTSFSAPFVAGAAALVKAARPDWGARAIIQTLLNTAKEVDANNPGFVGQLGYGRLDLASALQRAYRDRLNEEGVKSVYFFLGSKLYEYRPQENKKVYMFDFAERLVAMDYADLYNTGAYVMVLLSEKDGVYRVSVTNRDGRIYQSFKLPAGVTFDGLRADDLSDEIILGGGEKKNNYVFLRYSMFGRQKSRIQLTARPDRWTIRNNNTVVWGRVANGVLTVKELNWAGETRGNWALKQVNRLAAMAAGTVWASGLDQVVLLAEKSGRLEQYVVDLESGSYAREDAGSLLGDWYLLLKDENNDGLLDIFRFRKTGGNFSVTDSRGDLIKNIILPKINGFIGG